MTHTPATEAEEFVAELAEALTAPTPGECVFCHLARMTGQFGCDCEVLLDGWSYRDDLLVLDPDSGLLDWPLEDPVCELVRPGSAQGCTLWVPRRRDR